MLRRCSCYHPRLLNSISVKSTELNPFMGIKISVDVTAFLNWAYPTTKSWPNTEEGKCTCSSFCPASAFCKCLYWRCSKYLRGLVLLVVGCTSILWSKFAAFSYLQFFVFAVFAIEFVLFVECFNSCLFFVIAAFYFCSIFFCCVCFSVCAIWSLHLSSVCCRFTVIVECVLNPLWHV